jgi:hypothetical protein
LGGTGRLHAVNNAGKGSGTGAEALLDCFISTLPLLMGDIPQIKISNEGGDIYQEKLVRDLMYSFKEEGKAIIERKELAQ